MFGTIFSDPTVIHKVALGNALLMLALLPIVLVKLARYAAVANGSGRLSGLQTLGFSFLWLNSFAAMGFVPSTRIEHFQGHGHLVEGGLLAIYTLIGIPTIFICTLVPLITAARGSG